MLDALDMSFILAIGAFLWYIVLWLIGFLGCWTGRKRYRSHPSPVPYFASLPGVSIIRPLKGLDANLYENLESTFRQQYPEFEIILSVPDDHDQAIPIAQDVIRQYPQVRARIIIGEKIVGINPKVNNLIRAYHAATYDILWVIDSNIAVDPGTLARSVNALERVTVSGRRVGLVHHVPTGAPIDPKLGALVESAFLNTNHAKMYLAINTVAVESCVMGKSNLYRRSDIKRLTGTLQLNAGDEFVSLPTGLAAFGKYLAEDNMIASAIWHELGLRHELSYDVAQNIIGDMTLWDYIQRRIRWIRVRKHMVLAATLAEPFTESIVLSLLGSVSINTLFGVPHWWTVVIHFFLLICVDLDIYSSLSGRSPISLIGQDFVAGWLLRELLALPIFLCAIFGNEVVWRGTRYEVLRHGEAKRSDS